MTTEVQHHSVIITSLTIDRPDGRATLLGIDARRPRPLRKQPSQHHRISVTITLD